MSGRRRSYGQSADRRQRSRPSRGCRCKHMIYNGFNCQIMVPLKAPRVQGGKSPNSVVRRSANRCRCKSAAIPSLGKMFVQEGSTVAWGMAAQTPVATAWVRTQGALRSQTCRHAAKIDQTDLRIDCIQSAEMFESLGRRPAGPRFARPRSHPYWARHWRLLGNSHSRHRPRRIGRKSLRQPMRWSTPICNCRAKSCGHRLGHSYQEPRWQSPEMFRLD